ncbi:MAG: peptidyl-prolyl cis-trans isomerase [Pseudomonadota bacterium]|nr:peptidyl-prolyl cis-trans isomerase [Pseudomonadota bacterium]
MNNRIIFAGLLACFMGFHAGQLVAEPLNDKAALLVGNFVYTKQEIERARLFLTITSGASPDRLIDYQQTIKQIVAMRLQLNYATRLGLGLSKQELEQAEKELLQQNKVKTRAQLQQKLIADRIDTEMFFEFFTNQILLKKLYQQVIMPQVSVIDAEVNDYITKAQEASARLNVIDYKFSDKPQHQLHETDLRGFVKALRSGSKLTPAQKAYKIERKKMSDIALQDMPELFKENLKGLDQKQVTEPFKAANGWHVIKVVDKRVDKNSIPTFDQAKMMIFNKKIEDKVSSWVEELMENEFYKVLD